MSIQEQYEKERRNLEINRSLDWSTIRKRFIVANEELAPMTVQVWFDLLLLKSPVVSNQEITVESVVDYVWRNSLRYTEKKILKEWRLFWLQRRILKALNKKESSEQLVKVVCEHIKESFDEFPESIDGSMAAGFNTMPTVSGEAAMLDEIASRYGINPLEVLKIPLRRAFALQRTMRTSQNPDYRLLEPASLREIKSQYLNNLNNGNQ